MTISLYPVFLVAGHCGVAGDMAAACKKRSAASRHLCRCARLCVRRSQGRISPCGRLDVAGPNGDVAGMALGKSILGALLGGYGGSRGGQEVDRLHARRREILFAVIAPLGILIGRIGCLQHGCCAGIVCQPAWFTLAGVDGKSRWPAVPAEIAFNALALATILVLRNRKILPGQHFHLYLMACGLFRFFHEFLRDTPRVAGPWSGYQIISLAVFGLGAWGFHPPTRAGGHRKLN